MTKKKSTKKEKEINYQEKSEEYLNGWKRIKADFENYKKDEEQRVKNIGIFVKTGLILEFLPILDSLDEAIKHIPKEELETEWVKGIIAIQKQVTKILENNDVKEIDALGKEFDPFYHEAVGEAIGKKSDKDKVIRVIQKGYTMGKQVIRPSRVYVGK